MSNDLFLITDALKEIPFGVGKKLLATILRGEDSHPSVLKNRLDKLSCFGTCAYTEAEIYDMIDQLIFTGEVLYKPISSSSHIKVLSVGSSNKTEIKTTSKSFGSYEKTIITDQEKRLFTQLDAILHKYNDEQKKAIISAHKKILCVAGAGCGKTSTLIKRIHFLLTYRSVSPQKVLAITFTKKARMEMKYRLNKAGVSGVQVETFNSFCEKILQKYSLEIYGSYVQMISTKEKFHIVSQSLKKRGYSLTSVLELYFKKSQVQGKTSEQLQFTFVNDCFFIRDYFTSIHQPIHLDAHIHKAAHIVQSVCQDIDSFMKQKGLRDYTDQLLDTISFFQKQPQFIPQFNHVLVDEYQDVNEVQIQLIELLRKTNLFAVGDPRQSIYGWRGSDITYITEFKKRYENAQIITLTKNYRSCQNIITLANDSIKWMGLPDLQAHIQKDGTTQLESFSSEKDEVYFVVDEIKKRPTKTIFVLARTNKYLELVSKKLREENIAFMIKSEQDEVSNRIVLSTVHSIKGMEADCVFVIGCSGLHFPSKVVDHPITEMIQLQSYEKNEEERRLFYVAITRAKSELFLTYTGNFHTKYITDSMKNRLEQKNKASWRMDKNSVEKRLRMWRIQKSMILGVDAYMVITDKCLLELSRLQPMDEKELNDIHGMGPQKVKRFGKEILTQIHGF